MLTLDMVCLIVALTCDNDSVQGRMSWDGPGVHGSPMEGVSRPRLVPQLYALLAANSQLT
jgi:hypothetical protein